MKDIKLNFNYSIGYNKPCFIIAEIGSNHDNSYTKAIKLINKAKEAGADGVKFQIFSADKHYSKYTPGFKYLKKRNTYNLIKKLEIDRNWIKKLKTYCDKKKIIFFASPCDLEAIEILKNINTELYKVASFDITDLNLIKNIAKLKKPIILSTGMCSETDISDAIKTCKKYGNNKIILLQCTSLYPAPKVISNLNSIKTMRDKFQVITGYSDHTLDEDAALISICLGSKVLEKHFTLSKKLKGPDHKFACEPQEFKKMVNKIRLFEKMMGDGKKKGPNKLEIEMFKKGRRSIHAVRNIKKGEILKFKDIIIKRPGLGIKPKDLTKILNKKVKKNILKDKWITKDMI
tara:strand:- start:1150 stop:2187 length:1038 start_codon:yes stop_codon:yes gene_type:complete